MIDAGYKLVFLLYLTGLATFLPSFIEIEAQYTSLALLALNCLYLFHYWPIVRQLLGKRSFQRWAVLLFLWPLLQVLLLMLGGEEASPRSLGVPLRDATLLLCGAVFVYRHGWAELRRLIGIAFVITVIGFVLNWIWPDEFARVSYFQEESAEFHGRAASFFKNAGRAYTGVVLYALLLTADISKLSLRSKVATVLGMWVLTALTGSRSGLLCALAATMLIGWSMRNELRGRLRFSRQLAVAAVILVAMIGSALAVLALSWVGEEFVSEKYESLAERWGFLGKLGSMKVLQEDQSISARLAAQRTYLALIAERPLLGHGPVESRALLDIGILDSTSHNAFLEAAFDYGIPYAFFLALVLVAMVRTRLGAAPAAGLQGTVIRNFGAVVLIVCFATSEILANPAVIAMLGAVLGFKTAPARVLGLASRSASGPEPGPAPGEPYRATV